MKKKILLGCICALLMACSKSEQKHHDHNEAPVACNGYEKEHDHDHDHAAHGHKHAESEHHPTHDHHHDKAACADGHAHEHDEAIENSHSATDEVEMSVEAARLAGVEAEVAERGAFHEVLEVSGRVLAAQVDETSIISPATGVVRLASALAEGRKVAAGAELFYIETDRLQDGSPVAKNKVAYETAKDEYERAERLLEKQLITRSEFNAISERYETARIAYEATARGGSASRLAVKANSAGYLQSCNVKDGDFVEAGAPLASVVKNNRFYLQADVPLSYRKMLPNVRAAKFVCEGSEQVVDTRDLSGRVISYGRSVAAGSAYLPVTFEVDYHASLIPGAFASIYLLTGERKGVLALPRTALVEEQGAHFVYVKTATTCYRKQPVQTGATDGERVEILSGLSGGEQVVVRGAIHLKLASAASVIPAHNHNH